MYGRPPTPSLSFLPEPATRRKSRHRADAERVPRCRLGPAMVSRSLLSLHGDAVANDPVFASRKGDNGMTDKRLIYGRADKFGFSEISAACR